MKRKNIIFNLVIVLLLAMLGCGKTENIDRDDVTNKEEQSEKEAEVNESLEELESLFSAQEIEDDEIEIDEEVDETYIAIEDATDFSNGYAWIKLWDEEMWYCIDTSGNVTYKIKCTTISDHIGDYAVVDNAYIISNSGEIVLNFFEEDYELVDVQAFEVNRAILKKEVDTFEISGMFYYCANLISGEVIEIDFTKSEFYNERGKNLYNLEMNYLGNGYYEFNDYTKSLYSKIQFYSSNTNEIVDIADIEESYISIELLNCFEITIPDKNMVGIVYYQTVDIIDLDSQMLVRRIKNVEDFVWIPRIIGDHLLGYYFDDNYKNVTDRWFYDIKENEDFQLVTQFDENGYDTLFYSNNCMGISVKNDVGTDYLAVVDKTGATVFEPVKYEKVAAMANNNAFVYYNEGMIYIVSCIDWRVIASYMVAEENQDIQTLKYNDRKGEGYIFVSRVNSDNFYYTFDGNIIRENTPYEPSDNGYTDGYLKVKLYSGNSYEFWDYNGKKLEITINN